MNPSPETDTISMNEQPVFSIITEDLPELPRMTALESQAIIKGRYGDGAILVGMVNPRNGLAFDAVCRGLNLPRRQLERVQISEEEFQLEFQARYKSEGESEALLNWNDFGNNLGISPSSALDIQWADDLNDDEEEERPRAPAPNLTGGASKLDQALTILEQAQALGASDIHFMPEIKSGSVRLRIDGKISPYILRFKRREFKAMVNTIITRAGLDPEELERRRANSKVMVDINGRRTEYRASFMPTELGTSVVLRINFNVITDISKLGFERDALARIKRGMERPKGMILIAGPTGSGKSNTMESLICHLDDGSLIILQIGDPNEFIVAGRYQIKVTGGELTIEEAYDQALRHDPDMLIPGEIQFRHQAVQALKGAQTGHLLMTTIHAGSASETVSRLIGMDVDPFILSEMLIMVVGQRLIPLLCRYCRVGDAENPGQYLINHGGCKYCLFRGTYNRTAVGEVLLVTPRIKSLIRTRAAGDEIERVARGEGMVTMQECAERKVKAGLVARSSVRMELGDLDTSDLPPPGHLLTTGDEGSQLIAPM